MKKKRFTNHFFNTNNHFINSLFIDSNNKKIVLNLQWIKYFTHLLGRYSTAKLSISHFLLYAKTFAYMLII